MVAKKCVMVAKKFTANLCSPVLVDKSDTSWSLT